MKKIIAILLTLALVMASAGGAMAKGKSTSNGNGKGNGNSKGVSQEISEKVNKEKLVNIQENNFQESTRQQNKATIKRIREELRAERKLKLKMALKKAGNTDTEADDITEEYQPICGQFKVKGKHPVFDVPPVIKAGRTLIPVRAVTEGLGAEVAWDPEEQKVTISRDGKVIEIYLLTKEILVDGEEVEIEVPAGMLANRVFVPIRFISETLGDNVAYDEETGDITVGDDEEEAEENENQETDSEEDTDNTQETDETDDTTDNSDDTTDNNEDNQQDDEESSDENDEDITNV